MIQFGMARSEDMCRKQTWMVVLNAAWVEDSNLWCFDFDAKHVHFICVSPGLKSWPTTLYEKVEVGRSWGTQYGIRYLRFLQNWDLPYPPVQFQFMLCLYYYMPECVLKLSWLSNSIFSYHLNAERSSMFFHLQVGCNPVIIVHSSGAEVPDVWRQNGFMEAFSMGSPLPISIIIHIYNYIHTYRIYV